GEAGLVHVTKTELFQTVLASKIFEAAAMARPIVLGVEGFAAELVSGAGAGRCIEPENERELVDAVLRLADDRALAHRLGEAGRNGIAADYDYDRLAERYAELLGKVAAEARRWSSAPSGGRAPTLWRTRRSWAAGGGAPPAGPPPPPPAPTSTRT